MEITRRLIDLFFVSVLLDAGAGDVWRFSEAKTGAQITRSEGIAVASMYMFLDGAFSSDTSCSVDCKLNYPAPCRLVSCFFSAMAHICRRQGPDGSHRAAIHRILSDLRHQPYGWDIFSCPAATGRGQVIIEASRHLRTKRSSRPSRW